MCRQWLEHERYWDEIPFDGIEWDILVVGYSGRIFVFDGNMIENSKGLP